MKKIYYIINKDDKNKFLDRESETWIWKRTSKMEALDLLYKEVNSWATQPEGFYEYLVNQLEKTGYTEYMDIELKIQYSK